MAANITITRKARGTGSYRITSPNGSTVLLEVTPTKCVINGLEIGTGGLSSNLIPATDGIYDLGSDVKNWSSGFFRAFVCNHFRGFSSSNVPEWESGFTLTAAAGANSGLELLAGVGVTTLVPSGPASDPTFRIQVRDAGKLQLMGTSGGAVLSLEGPGTPGVVALAVKSMSPGYANPVSAASQAGIITFHAGNASIDVVCDHLHGSGFVIPALLDSDADMTSVVATTTGVGTFTLTAKPLPPTGTVHVGFLVVNPASC